MAKKKKMWAVQPATPQAAPRKSVVRPGKMSADELAEYQLMLTRGRRFADRSKQASKRACRGTSAGRDGHL